MPKSVFRLAADYVLGKMTSEPQVIAVHPEVHAELLLMGITHVGLAAYEAYISGYEAAKKEPTNA